MVFNEQGPIDTPIGDEKKSENKAEKNIESQDGLDAKLVGLSSAEKNTIGIQLEKDIISGGNGVSVEKPLNKADLSRDDTTLLKTYLEGGLDKGTVTFTLTGGVDGTQVINPYNLIQNYKKSHDILVKKGFDPNKLPSVPEIPLKATYTPSEKLIGNQMLAWNRAISPLVYLDDTLFNRIKDKVVCTIDVGNNPQTKEERYIKILADGRELLDITMDFKGLDFKPNVATMEKMSPETDQSFQNLVKIMNLPQFQNEKLEITGHIQEKDIIDSKTGNVIAKASDRREKPYATIPAEYKAIFAKYAQNFPFPEWDSSKKDFKTLTLTDIKPGNPLFAMEQEIVNNKTEKFTSMQKVDADLKAYILHNWPEKLSQARAEVVKDYILELSQKEGKDSLFPIQAIDPKRIVVHAAGNSILNYKAITYKLGTMIDTLPQTKAEMIAAEAKEAAKQKAMSSNP